MARRLPNGVAGISEGVSSTLMGIGNGNGDHAGPKRLQGGWGTIESVMKEV